MDLRDEDIAFLTERMETLIRSHGCDARVDRLVDAALENALSGVVDIDILVDGLQALVEKELPPEIREELCRDIGSIVNRRRDADGK